MPPARAHHRRPIGPVFGGEQGEAFKRARATEDRCRERLISRWRWPAAAIHNRSMGGDVVMLSRPVWRRR